MPSIDMNITVKTDIYPSACTKRTNNFHNICTVEPLYNTIVFSSKYSQKTSHSSPVRARYGVSFVSSKPDPYPTPVDVVVYLISAIMNRVIKRFYCMLMTLRISILLSSTNHINSMNTSAQWLLHSMITWLQISFHLQCSAIKKSVDKALLQCAFKAFI